MSTEQNPQFDSTTAETRKQRDEKGRFMHGNVGGPGNPYARQSAQLRQAMIDNVSKEEIAKIIKSMVILAIAGNIPAAKLVLQYTVGKPTDAVNPDRLDQEEFNAFKEANGMYAESVRMVLEPDSKLPVGILRGTREGMFESIRDQIVPALRKGTKDEWMNHVPKENGDNGAAGQQAPIGNGVSGDGVPLENGDIGTTAPIENGSNGRGPELFDRYGPKMSRRALRKARKTAKLAAMMPSKNGKH